MGWVWMWDAACARHKDTLHGGGGRYPSVPPIGMRGDGRVVHALLWRRRGEGEAPWPHPLGMPPAPRWGWFGGGGGSLHVGRSHPGPWRCWQWSRSLMNIQWPLCSLLHMHEGGQAGSPLQPLPRFGGAIAMLEPVWGWDGVPSVVLPPPASYPQAAGMRDPRIAPFCGAGCGSRRGCNGLGGTAMGRGRDEGGLGVLLCAPPPSFECEMGGGKLCPIDVG